MTQSRFMTIVAVASLFSCLGSLRAEPASTDQQIARCSAASERLRKLEDSSGILWKVGKYAISFLITEGAAKIIVKASKGNIKNGIAGFAAGAAVEFVMDHASGKIFEDKIAKAERICRQKADAREDFDPIIYMLNTVADSSTKNDGESSVSNPSDSAELKKFMKFTLDIPKPTDCHNATFHLIDTADGKPYTVILRDQEQINACSINFTASDSEIAGSVARFVGLIGEARFAYLSALGDCKQRTLRIVDKRSTKEPIERVLTDNCNILKFTLGPTRLASRIAQYFGID